MVAVHLNAAEDEESEVSFQAQGSVVIMALGETMSPVQTVASTVRPTCS